MFGFQERQRKREAPPQPLVEEESGLSEDAAAAENTAAMAVAAGEVAAATAQAHAALPGSEEHKTAEVKPAVLLLQAYFIVCHMHSFRHRSYEPLGCANVGAWWSHQHALCVQCSYDVQSLQRAVLTVFFFLILKRDTVIAGSCCQSQDEVQTFG